MKTGLDSPRLRKLYGEPATDGLIVVGASDTGEAGTYEAGTYEPGDVCTRFAAAAEAADAPAPLPLPGDDCESSPLRLSDDLGGVYEEHPRSRRRGA